NLPRWQRNRRVGPQVWDPYWAIASDHALVGLGPGLWHLTTRRAHLGCRCVCHQSRIIENRAQLKAFAEAADGGLGAVSMHPGNSAGCAGCLANLLDRPENFFFLGIERRGLSHAQR